MTTASQAMHITEAAPAAPREETPVRLGAARNVAVDAYREVQIEVNLDSDAERVRAHVEQAIYRALSLRPAVTVAQPGKLTRFAMKAGRFQRLDRS